MFSSLYSWLPTPSTGQALGGRPSTGGEGPAVGKGPHSGRPGWPGTGTPASHTASLLTPDGSRASWGPRSLLTRGHSAGATASALRIGCGAGLFPPPLPLAGPQPVPTLADPWEPARKGDACQKKGVLAQAGEERGKGVSGRQVEKGFCPPGPQHGPHPHPDPHWQSPTRSRLGSWILGSPPASPVGHQPGDLGHSTSVWAEEGRPDASQARVLLLGGWQQDGASEGKREQVRGADSGGSGRLAGRQLRHFGLWAWEPLPEPLPPPATRPRPPGEEVELNETTRAQPPPRQAVPPPLRTATWWQRLSTARSPRRPGNQGTKEQRHKGLLRTGPRCRGSGRDVPCLASWPLRR